MSKTGKTPQFVQRSGIISVKDECLSITEKDVPSRRDWQEYKTWERQFKIDVFKRIIQQLRRLGWSVGPRAEKLYDNNNHRYCVKGDLKADLSLLGNNITLDFFQSINAPDRPDNEGRYQHDKLKHMPYLLKLEMLRTQNRICTYLSNVMSDYSIEEQPKKMGPFGGITALQAIEQDVKNCWHYNPDLGRRAGETRGNNNRSAEGKTIEHGQRVWFADYSGRMLEGTAYYNINNMWWVICGLYSKYNVGSHQIYVENPGSLRVKRNEALRLRRLSEELSKAVESMSFEKAAILRDVLYPPKEPLYVLLHSERQLYHGPNFSGYTNQLTRAGKFTAEEIKGWEDTPGQKIIPLSEAVV